MKVGYPCRNLSLSSKSSNTFQLKSYSDAKLETIVEANLAGLRDMVDFNIKHGLLYTRITSDLVPFASHPACTLDWRSRFATEMAEIGPRMRESGMRVSMHPGQYVLLNSPRPEVVKSSVAELQYHADVLDLLGVDVDARIQIHVGGVYGDKPGAIDRFAEGYAALPESIRRRLSVENDERSYCLADCLEISERTGVPVIFDVFHHSIYHQGETVPEALRMAAGTWRGEVGILLVDYSTQAEGKQTGAHTMSIEIDDFRAFAIDSAGVDFDLMLEIKDKEKSALAALDVLRELDDPRLVSTKAAVPV